MKNKSLINKIIDSRITWMLLSLLIAFFLWSYVASQDKQEISKTFVGVPVQFIGEDVIRESRSLVIIDPPVSTVEITVTGTRRALSALSADDLIAQVDVTKLSTPGTSDLDYTIIYPNRVDSSSFQITGRVPSSIMFKVSTLSQKQIDVHGVFLGSTAHDDASDVSFEMEDPVFEPSTITVTGAEIYLKDIKDAWVSFGEGQTISGSYTVDACFVLRDKNDQEISSANVEFSDNIIQARQPIRRLKTVPLEVSFHFGSGATEENIKYTIEPQFLKLSGDSATLDAVNTIKLDQIIDTTDFAESKEYTLPIIVPPELTNKTGIAQAKVKVEIVGLSTKAFNVENISCVNVPEGFYGEIITKSFVVTLRGTEEQLNQISAENIKAEVDMSARQTAGAYSMKVTKISVVGFQDDEVGSIGEEAPKVLVELKTIEEDE